MATDEEIVEYLQKKVDKLKGKHKQQMKNWKFAMMKLDRNEYSDEELSDMKAEYVKLKTTLELQRHKSKLRYYKTKINKKLNSSNKKQNGISTHSKKK